MNTSTRNGINDILCALGSSLILTTILLAGAVFNGFPLIFPDSGTYLAIALGSEYAIDRSSYYGFLLKPFVSLSNGVGGLWIAISVQAFIIASILVSVARESLPRNSKPLLYLIPIVFLTSLPWHAAQFMPDAFTGPMILVVWLAARRNLKQSGTLLLWLAAVTIAVMHYTHVILLGITAVSVILVDFAMNRSFLSLRQRTLTALTMTLLSAFLLVAANGIVLNRWTIAPLGPTFLFARLNEDGLIPRWLDAHCGGDGPAPLCAERNHISSNSQTFLWRDPQGIVARHIWGAADPERWRWVDMMDQVNRSAVSEQPRRFAVTALNGSVRQFVHFALLDDECPQNCLSTRSGIGFALLKYRPSFVPVLQASRQDQGTMPKSTLRMITNPIGFAGLLLFPAVIVLALRRRDALIASLAVGVAAALVTNAVVAGALSDVHDRYQSRVVWLVPMVVLLTLLRWRSRQEVQP